MSCISMSALAASAMSIVAICASANDQVGSFRTIAIANEQAAGLPSGTNYAFFHTESLRINNAGKVAFMAELSGSGVNSSNNRAVFTDSGLSSLNFLARRGQQAEGMPPGVNHFILGTETLQLNNAGQILFRSNLSGPGIDFSNRTTVFSNAEGAGFVPIARTGTPAGDLGPDVILDSYDGLVEFNDLGQAAFMGRLIGPEIDQTNNRSILSHTPGGQLTSIARTGETALGLDPDTVFTSLSRPVLSNAGAIGFSGATRSPEGDLTIAIFTNREGNGFAPAHRNGDSAAGLPEGTPLSFAGNFRINDSGDVAFVGAIPGQTIGNSNVFINRQGEGTTLLALNGTQAPGLPEGINYDLINQLNLNNSGDVAFVASLREDGANVGNGVFATNTAGELHAIAYAGQQAVSQDVGITYLSFEELTINDAGQAAFFGGLRDGFTFFSGIFATDKHGKLLSVAVEGGLIDISDDPTMSDYRTIISVSRDFDFNDKGELLFNAVYDGGQGIFVATVPAPAGAPLFAVAALMVSRRRRN